MRYPVSRVKARILGDKSLLSPNSSSSLMILNRKFYERDTLTVARELLGKFLVHENTEGTTVGKIVETEAYIGPEDKASHAYNNLRTQRTGVQFGPKGHAYIYQVYGMYFCLNVTSGSLAGKPEAILVRALEPTEGVELMIRRRGYARSRIVSLANGPSKLCIAMGISKKQNGADLCVPPLCVKTGVTINIEQVVQTTRVNVDYAEEWKDLPWRFFIRDSCFVSKPGK
jgi:DNA-3-methyladenine glycosylase